jgi:hypothetical protein
MAKVRETTVLPTVIDDGDGCGQWSVADAKLQISVRFRPQRL